MAQRPIWSSVFAFGMAAAAMRFASGPPTPTPNLGGAAVSGHAVSAKGRGGESGTKPGWADSLKDDPEGAGKAAGEAELREKICRFVACAGEAKGGAPEVVIAVAPDPVHTQMALLFDRYIDGLEDGLQDSGWIFQGNWMPWRAGGGTNQESGEIEGREEQRLYESGKEQLPGVMLFGPLDRSEAGIPRRRRLIVLVVGDSPTTGVVGVQFVEALRQFAALSAAGEPLRILGPNFTGSGPSLKGMLGEAKDKDGQTPLSERHEIRVVSGSVSDWNCGHFLPGIKRDLAHPRGDDCGSGKNTFSSFGVDGAWEAQQTSAFLLAHGGMKAEEIAQLTEDESGYGALLRQDKSVAPTQEPSGDGVLRLTFPRGISHLRSAYQKNAVWGFGGSSGASSVNLSLDFEEPHHGDDSVPSYAQAQMPVSQEGSMGQVASALEQHRIKAVLVSASDVLDELFVAQILARQAPNVTVILRGTDVLFLRSGDRGIYRNMYTVSPWPLVRSNAYWSESAQSRGLVRSFPSGDAEAVYTAVRTLFEERLDGLQDYRPPIKADGLALDRPPLWFSAIGHGEFWPVAMLNDTLPPKRRASAVQESAINLPRIVQRPGTETATGDEAGRSQRVMLLIAFVLSFVHAGKCMQWPLMERIAPQYGIYEPHTRRAKLSLQLGMTVLGVLMLCLVYEPSAGWSGKEYVWRILFLGSMALLSVTLTRLCGDLYQPPGGGDAAVSNGNLWLLLTPLFLVVTYEFWTMLWNWLPACAPAADGMAKFFYFRSRHPFSGASPVLPLLLALSGVTLILYSHLGRLTFSPGLAPRLPARVPQGLNCPGRTALHPVERLLRWPLPGRGVRRKLRIAGPKILLFGVVVLTSIVITASLGLSPEMLESRQLSYTYAATAFVVLTGLLWDLLMASLLWSRMKTVCLTPLETSPLRRGFNLVHGLTWRSLWLMPQGGYVQYRAFMRALEQTTRRLMDGPAERRVGQESLREATAGMWTSMARHNRGEAIAEFGRLQDRMAGVAQELLRGLEGLWREEVGLITAADHHVEQASGVSNAEDLRSVAEEWVALIYVHYIRLVLVQIRNRLSTAAMLYILLVWSVTSYPFLNRHVLMIALSVLLGILAFAITSTYASINRDPILSRTTDEKPGKLDFDFYAKTASMVGIPLLGFVASQFPEVSNFLFSWVQPGMTALK